MDAETNKTIIDTIVPYGPKEIGVFGSYARDGILPDSDIDLMVDLNDEVSLFDFGGLYMDLCEKLGKKSIWSLKMVSMKLLKNILNVI